MGRLLTRDKIDLDAPWYFDDAYYTGSSQGYRYEWPSPNYPFSCAIPSDKITNSLKIKIRGWVESNLPDTVFLETVEHDYVKYYGESATWERSYEVRNRWTKFYFDNEHSLVAFSLVFSEYIHPITKHSPNSPEDEYWCTLTKQEQKEYYEKISNNSKDR